MKSKEVFAQAKAKAQAALEVDNDEERTALVQEADVLFKKATELKSAESLLDQIQEPQMPADLPVDDGDGTNPAPKSATKAVNPLYVMQYGDEDTAIKAVLNDLHGADYQQKRWEQRQGFVKYLRTGRGESREFLWTPETIKVALEEGQDVKAMKTVMVEAISDLGGYVVPEDFRAEVVSRMAGYTVVRPLARVVQTSRDSVEFPVMTGGGDQYRDAVRVTWVTETPTAGTAATNLTFGQEKIPVHEVMAETFLSRALVEDAAFNITGWLADSFASAQAIDEDNKFLKNDGMGSPEGILLDDANRSTTNINEEVSGNASALTSDGLIGLVYDIAAQYRQNARFVAARATYKAIRKLKTGDGEYLWERNYQAGQPERLLGYPILEQEGMPSVTATYYPVLFGDFRGYYIVDRIGMSVERYLDSATARIGQVCFLARRRLGGQCMEPWRFAAQRVGAS